MKEILYKEIYMLRLQGYTFKEIGKKLGINKGVAYRILKKGKGYSEKVGNKNRLHYYPAWEYLSPDFIYGDVFKLTHYYCKIFDVNFDFIIDWILDRIYMKDFSVIEKPETYVKVFIIRTLLHRKKFKEVYQNEF